MWYSFHPTDAYLPAGAVADSFKDWVEAIVTNNGGMVGTEANPPPRNPRRVYCGLFHTMLDYQKEAVLKA